MSMFHWRNGEGRLSLEGLHLLLEVLVCYYLLQQKLIVNKNVLKAKLVILLLSKIDLKIIRVTLISVASPILMHIHFSICYLRKTAI